MKRIRFLALAMVFAIMLMGVGYAAWTDTITVNTTVKTGTFDVQFTQPEASKLDGTAVPGFGSRIGVYPGTAFSAVLTDSDTITVNAGNLYPGAEFQVVTRASNAGTIAAILNNITLDGVDPAEQALLNVLQLKIVYSDGPNNAPNYEIYSGPVSGVAQQLFPGKLIDLGITPLEHHDSDAVTFTFEFPFETPEGYENNEDYLENTTAVFDMNFNWVQFNIAEHTN